MEPMTNRITAGSGPMTVADLEGMPEDGRRYELIDGTLIVSPAPGTRHQRLALKLWSVLDAACPPTFGALAAPFAVHHGDNVELQPDVVVARLEDFTARDLPKPPVLVVEVLSPSTAIHDLNTKKAVYERMGVPSYWVIDPIDVTLTAFELVGSNYVQTAAVEASETFVAQQPFDVSFTLTELLGRFA